VGHQTTLISALAEVICGLHNQHLQDEETIPPDMQSINLDRLVVDSTAFTYSVEILGNQYTLSVPHNGEPENYLSETSAFWAPTIVDKKTESRLVFTNSSGAAIKAMQASEQANSDPEINKCYLELDNSMIQQIHLMSERVDRNAAA